MATRASPTMLATLIPFLTLALTLTLAGCGERKPSGDHAGHDHSDAHGHDEGESAVKYKDGHGLQLAAETTAALGVTTVEVGERTIAPSFEITASVFEVGPPARASSLVPAEVAEALEKNPPAEATLLSVRRDLSSALTQVEIVLALRDAPAVGSTVNLTLHCPARTNVAVPLSSVLRSASGTFVYVANGAHLLRTPVKTGASDGEYSEIIDGLYAGDVVVTAAVEQLWLTELRLTKGGGHSH